MAAIEDQNIPKPEEPPPPAPQVLTKPPQLLEFFGAEYPEELLYAEVGGEAILYVDIDAKGLVEQVEILSVTHPDFALPAMVAASRFIFSPAEINDRPAGIRIEYRYVFTPQLPEPDAVTGAAAEKGREQQPVNFSGVVLEAGIRKPVPGAVVSIGGRPVAETDANGEFSVRGVIPGALPVRVTGPYHDTYEGEEELGEDEAIRVKFYLLRTSFDPYETVVRAKVSRREVSKIQLERKELEKVPGTFGDPVRVIENLPGMARTPGGLGGALLVRGANPEETKVFLDGIEIPLIYHFGGLTSVIAAGFLERIDFYPGGFGARYGGATAGIVDVATRELDCDAVHGYGKADFMDAAAYACAPIGEWNVAAAGRRSYIDALLPIVLDQIPRDDNQGTVALSPVYWDYQAKAQGKLSESQLLDILAFGSDDRFKVVTSGSAEDLNFDFGLVLGFHRLVARHKFRIRDDLLLTSTLSPGWQGNSFVVAADTVGEIMRFNLDVYSLAWREDLILEVTDGLQFNAGIDARIGRADLKIAAPFPTSLRIYPAPTFDITNTHEITERFKVYNHAYYLEAIWEPGFGLKVIPGLRFERWDFHHTQDYSVLPRLTSRWEFLEGMTAKAAYGLYEMLPEANFLMENPAGNPSLPPLRSHHFIGGYEHSFTELVQVDLQVFYNLRRQIPTQSRSVTVEGGQLIGEVLAPDGGGRTYGLEILLRHLATADGWFYGWLSYTLSRAIRFDHPADATYLIEGASDAGEYPYPEEHKREYLSDFDQTHILTLVAQFVLPWGFEAGARYRLVSGNPYTPIRQGRVYHDVDADSYSIDTSLIERNGARMPNFHQLDVRVDKKFTFDTWSVTVYLEVINAYNAKNVEQYQYDYRYRKRQALTLLPIIPIIGVKGEF